MLGVRPTRWDARVEEICRAWEGTPYRLNRCVKGLGADCLHFAAAVLDELYGTEHSKGLQSLPPDACIHNREGVMAAARALFEKYPAIQRVADDRLEAGDLFICGRDQEINSAQHLMVVGGSCRLWHCSPPRVHCTGLEVPLGLKLVCVYRATDKHLWPC